LLLAAAGCGSGGSSTTGDGGAHVQGAAVLVGKVEALHSGSISARQVAAADSEFGFDLFARLCASAPNANLTLSPASAAQALGMLDAGAAGGTRTAVGKLLHLPEWSPALVAALHARAAALASVAQVEVSNHVFEQKGLSPTSSTLNDLKTAYDADLRQLDFAAAPAAATDAINTVISHDTKALIPTLFDSPLDPTTRTVLANAVVLDAKWQQPFPSAVPGRFHTASGKDEQATMMNNSEASLATRSASGWQSVVLPYDGGKLEAVAMLPPPTSSGCAAPTAAVLSALTAGPSTGDGVVLPKLDLSQTLPLTKTLAGMGLPLQGDYSGLGAADNEISEVVQKVVMKVDKQGTKAAAATGIGITTSARVANQVVTFDRPFLLLLEDTATHTPLFLAHVADPNAA
jgi:serpin B